MMRILSRIRILKFRILRIYSILSGVASLSDLAISIPLAFVIRDGGCRWGLNKP